MVDEDTEIFMFGVISLYRSIRHEFSFEALDYFLTTYHEDVRPRFKKEFLLESANFIIKCNMLTFDSANFVHKSNMLTFDSEFYLQKKWTAISTISASTNGNLCMEYEIKGYFIICQSYALTSQ